MNKILIVDGHFLLFRMFTGMPFAFTDDNGNIITATVGFVGTVVKMIKHLNATHVVVVFDGENAREEREVCDSDYKANRVLDYKEEEDSPFVQLEKIKKILTKLNIYWHETDACEADDFIAALTALPGEKYISSNDSDFFQLVNNEVFIYRYNGKKTFIIDSNYVYEKFGVHPKDYALFKSLMGDNSDNIKGLRGVGPKTAKLMVDAIVGYEAKNKEKLLDVYYNNKQKVEHNLKLIRLEAEGKCVIPNLKQLQANKEQFKNFKVLDSIKKCLE